MLSPSGFPSLRFLKFKIKTWITFVQAKGYTKYNSYTHEVKNSDNELCKYVT